MNPQDFANAAPYEEPDPQYAQQAQQASGGAQPTSGMPPYPLYGLPNSMGAAEPQVPFYKRAWFGWVGGTVLGAGLAYGWFNWLRPKLATVANEQEKKGKKK